MTNDYLRDLDDWDEESQRILLSLAENNEFISFDELEKGIYGKGKDPFEKIRINENSDRLVSPFYKEFGIEEGHNIIVDTPISIFNYTGKKKIDKNLKTTQDETEETEKDGFAYRVNVQESVSGSQVYNDYINEKGSFNPYHFTLYYEKLNKERKFNFTGQFCIINIGDMYYRNIVSKFPNEKIESYYVNKTKSMVVDSLESTSIYTKRVLDYVYPNNQLPEVNIYEAIKLATNFKTEKGSIMNTLGGINDSVAEVVNEIAKFIGKQKITEEQYLPQHKKYSPYIVGKIASSPIALGAGLALSTLESIISKGFRMLKDLDTQDIVPPAIKNILESLTILSGQINTMVTTFTNTLVNVSKEVLKLVNAFICGLINGLISLVEFLFQAIAFLIDIDNSIKSYEDYLERRKNLEVIEEVLNFVFENASSLLDGFKNLIDDIKNLKQEDLEKALNSIKEFVGDISRYHVAYYAGAIVFEVIVGVILAYLTGGSGNIAQAVSKSEKLIQFLKILGREFVSTVTFGITDLLAILRKLLQSFARACKNGFKGFIEWIRSLLKTEGKHLDEVLDEVGDLERRITDSFDLLGGRVLNEKDLKTLKKLLKDKYGVELKILNEYSSYEKLPITKGGKTKWIKAKELYADWNKRNVAGKFHEGPPPMIILRNDIKGSIKASELTTFHEMVHMNVWLSGKKINLIDEEIFVFEEIFKVKGKFKWTDAELIDSYDYVNGIIIESNRILGENKPKHVNEFVEQLKINRQFNFR